MGQTAVDSMAVGANAAAAITPWGLFLQADLIVKVVILLLLLASVWCWAIIFDKTRRLARLRRRADAFEDRFWSGGSLDELYDEIGRRPEDPMSAIFAAAMHEWRQSSLAGQPADPARRASLQQRIERAMNTTLAREMVQLERYMSFLASISANATFIGLFGTVWGIMNSFTAIAAAQNTNLAVVAPGIAEALFATALGLIAAIPAGFAYNKIATDLGRYASRLEIFAEEFAAILSRQLEEAS